MKAAIISGRQIALQERSKAQLKGVTIGEGSIIAAGSIVTKDVPPH